MSKYWQYVLPCYLFTLPMSLVGVLLGLLAYRAKGWAWRRGVLTCVAGVRTDGTTRIWGGPSGQTLGWVQIFDTEFSRDEVDLRVHETVHVVQSFVCSLVGMVAGASLAGSMWAGALVGGLAGGAGFAILYLLFFVYFYLKSLGKWQSAYYANPFETQAYNTQDKYLAGKLHDPWGL